MTEGTQARPERVMVLEPDAERRQMLAQTLMQSGFRLLYGGFGARRAPLLSRQARFGVYAADSQRAPAVV